jgi:hypothetical protein
MMAKEMKYKGYKKGLYHLIYTLKTGNKGEYKASLVEGKTLEIAKRKLARIHPNVLKSSIKWNR